MQQWDEHPCHNSIPEFIRNFVNVNARTIIKDEVKQAMENNTWTLEGRCIVTTCSCVDTTLAASSPASGTVGQIVPGCSGVDTTFKINPNNFLLQAVRHKYFPHILPFVCFWTNVYFDVYEMRLLTTEDHLPANTKMKILTEYKN